MKVRAKLLRPLNVPKRRKLGRPCGSLSGPRPAPIIAGERTVDLLKAMLPHVRAGENIYRAATLVLRELELDTEATIRALERAFKATCVPKPDVNRLQRLNVRALIRERADD
jgi:hypothetical protein